MDSIDGTQKATRQCWECLKRRLVCDYTLPHCRKCISKGRECPGYDAKKPLQWVEPGKVSSRKRRKAPSPKRSDTSTTKASSSHAVHPDGSSSDSEDDWSPIRIVNAYTKAFEAARSADDISRIIELDAQDRIEYIVSKRLRAEAAKLIKMEKDPLGGLERVLGYMRLEKLPSYNFQNETSEVVQAINYCTPDAYPHVKHLS